MRCQSTGRAGEDQLSIGERARPRRWATFSISGDFAAPWRWRHPDFTTERRQVEVGARRNCSPRQGVTGRLVEHARPPWKTFLGDAAGRRSARATSKRCPDHHHHRNTCSSRSSSGGAPAFGQFPGLGRRGDEGSRAAVQLNCLSSHARKSGPATGVAFFPRRRNCARQTNWARREQNRFIRYPPHRQAVQSCADNWCGPLKIRQRCAKHHRQAGGWRNKHLYGIGSTREERLHISASAPARWPVTPPTLLRRLRWKISMADRKSLTVIRNRGSWIEVLKPD